MIPREIRIGTKTYHYLRTREHQNVSVYRGDDAYFRIGSVGIIQKEICHHNMLLQYGFPVTKITESGWLFNNAYYIEKSFGEEQFSKFFIRDCLTHGEISGAHFRALLTTVKRYALAQINSATAKKSWRDFFTAIHAKILKKEAPMLAKKLKTALLKIQKKLEPFPFVISHGDFNAHNIFPKGVIDMEHVAYAPAGYDLITLIAQTDMFPLAKKYEFKRRYEFSQGQKEQYFSMVDALYARAGLPKLSMYKNEFRFYRAVWSAARMKKYPRLQAWRFYLVRQPYGRVFVHRKKRRFLRRASVQRLYYISGAP